MAKHKEKKKPCEASYYAISVSTSIHSLLETYFSTYPGLDSSFFKTLVSKNRIPKHHHVTLIHGKSRKQQEKLWDFYKNSTTTQPNMQATVELDKLVFDDK